MMLNCFDATRLLSEALDRPLSFKERIAIRVHLMMCDGCRNFGRQMHTLRLIAKTYAHKSDLGEPEAGTPPQEP